MKKKLFIGFGIVAGILIVGIIFFNIKLNKVIRSVNTEMAAMTEPDLSTVSDGVYNGAFGSIPVAVNLDVTVQGHHITAIIMKKQTSGKGYEATETMQRIIDSQKVKVDAVSGATLSSKCIMVAAYKALTTR